MHYRSKDGCLHSWSSKKEPIPHKLVLENGMYRPHVNGKIGDTQGYFPWMVNPARVVKLEYCTEVRLVKITSSTKDLPDTHVWFGCTNGVEYFVDNYKDCLLYTSPSP